MKLVGGAASGTGLTVQETAGALAALAQNGLEGGIAGTSLAGVLRRLQPQTQKAAGAMSDLGLNFVKANGEFDSIDVIAGKLQKSFKGMAPAARQARLSAIFGNDASVMQAVNALINTGAKGMRKYTKAASDQNAASSLAEARMKGVKGAIERMSGSLETAGLVLGKALIPFITKAADVIGSLADRFANLSPTAQKVVLVIGGIAAAIGPVLVVVGTLIASMGAIAGVFAGVTAAIAAPIAAFALVAVGVGLLLAKSEKARAVITGAFGEIQAAIMGAIGPVTDMITSQLLPAFEAMWPILEKVGVIMLQVFAGAVVGAIKGVINVVQGVVQVITGVVQVVSGILTGDWSRVWDGVKSIVSGALQALKGAIQVWLNVGFLAVFRKGFVLLKSIFSGGWAAGKALFTKGIGGLKAVLGKVIQIITAPFRAAFNVMRSVVSAGWNFIKGIFTNTLATIRGVVTGGLSAVRNVVSNGLSALRGIASSAMSGFRNAMSNGFNAVMGFVRGIPGKIKGALSGAGSWLKGIGADIVRGLGAGIESMYDWVRDKVNALSGWIPGWVKKRLGIASPSKVMAELGVWTAKGLAEGIADTIPAVANAVSGMVATIGNGFEELQSGAAVTAVTDTFANIAEGITSATEEQLAKQKRAYEKDIAERKKALEKKYGGKDEKKRLKKELKELERERAKHLRTLESQSKASAKALQALAVKDRDTILGLASQWDVLDAQLQGVKESYDNAVSELTSKVDELNAMSAKVRDSLISSVFKSEGDIPPTFDAMLASLTDQEAAAARYGEIMEQLAGLGLNPTSFQQIADAGVDGLAAAEALLASGQAGVDQVNALQASINSYAEKAGDTVANYLLGAGVTLAQSTVDSFAAQQSTLEAQMTTLGQAIATAFQTAIQGITLPGSGAAGGAGGGGNSAQKHKWEPKSKTNRKCVVCGKPRSNAIHTNRNDNNASGTLSAAGGWSRVGERGPELVRLPAGSRVYPARQTERIEGASDKPPAEIHVHMPTGDPEAAAMAVMNRFVRGL
jgi:phage-related protein